MSGNIDLKVHLAFDAEAGVWYVAASDIPGLRLEASDPMELVSRIAECAAELIDLNQNEIIETREEQKPRRMGFIPVFDSSVPIPAYA